MRRSSDRFLHKGIAVGYLILLISFAGGLYVLEKRDIRRTDNTSLAACKRTNALRDQVNRVSRVGFRVFYQSYQRELALARAGDPRDAKAHLRSATELKKDAYQLRYLPSANCLKAVEHPHLYKFPPARSFTPKDL